MHFFSLHNGVTREPMRREGQSSYIYINIYIKIHIKVRYQEKQCTLKKNLAALSSQETRHSTGTHGEHSTKADERTKEQEE